MKKIFLIFFLVLPGIMKAQFSGDTYAEAKKAGKASWTLTFANAPGFIYKDGQGKISGITVDLMEKFKDFVEEKEGIQISMTYKSSDPENFTKFLADVKQARGGVFGLSNTTITRERMRSYRFSPAYITNIGLVVSHKDVSMLENISEIRNKFSGMTAVTVKNSTNAKRLLAIREKHWKDMKIEYVSSFQEAMDAVCNSNTKFTDIDFTYYLSAVQARKPLKRHPGGDNLTEKFGIIMPKSNDWAPLLKEFMESGFVGSIEYKKIVANNLGQSAMKYLETL
ncbi:MAG: transporter substrate-binding domain-containing protein [Cyclobacteriaceae bacterium]